MKTTSKRTVLFILALIAMMAPILGACNTGGSGGNSGGNSGTETKTYKVGVIQYVSHPALDNCYNGIEQSLKNSPLGSSITIERQVGSSSSPDSDCDTYAKNMVAQGMDVIIAIATPAAYTAFSATEDTEIPVVFSAVTDPVAAELVQSNEEPGVLCTGTSDVLNMEAQVDLIQAMMPQAKIIGVLYTTSEPNSISQLEDLKAVASARGLTIESTGIQNDADIPAAATALAAKVDCIDNFTDNKIVSNLPILLEAAANAGIPVFGSEIEQVRNGCLAAVSIDYVALGVETGEMVLDILQGADAAKMAVRTISDADPVINLDVLEALEMEIPEAYADAETLRTGE
ncbi:MAG: ABC transporter substrate-binding protein [Eubacteriaceae bacterium]|nr:ABC transporter substrate-binding protein [Eubacteriaceae bacterium]